MSFIHADWWLLPNSTILCVVMCKQCQHYLPREGSSKTTLKAWNINVKCEVLRENSCSLQRWDRRLFLNNGIMCNEINPNSGTVWHKSKQIWLIWFEHICPDLCHSAPRNSVITAKSVFHKCWRQHVEFNIFFCVCVRMSNYFAKLT